jgi:hypothetical protein
MVAEQVAEWHVYMDPFNFAHAVESVGRLYNEALASVEAESFGRATIQELQARYWNIYRQERIDTYDGSLTNKLGWVTDLRSKKALISFGTYCISGMTIITHGKELVEELMTFIQDDSGGASAAGRGYDDRVMAGLIGLYTMHRFINDEPADSSVFQVRKPPISRSTVDIDLEFARILSFGKEMDYDKHWLND